MNNKEVMGNMLSVIKTAMITIIISFTSGVLLDLYKNVAPRIVCKIIRCKNANSNDNDVKEYNLTIKNVSKKTIHNLNVHIQSEMLCESFEINDENITYGLKYDISEEENIYSINIPFLSKNDEFSAKLLLKDSHNIRNKPIVILRSPDNFKRVDSFKDKIQKETNIFNKKILIAIISLNLIIFTGIIAVSLLNKTSKSIEEPAIESSDEDVTNSEEKTPSNGTSSNSNKKTTSNSNTSTSTGKNSTTNNSTEVKDENSEEDNESSSSATTDKTTSNSIEEGISQEVIPSEKKESTTDSKTSENSNTSLSDNSAGTSSSSTTNNSSTNSTISSTGNN